MAILVKSVTDLLAPNWRINMSQTELHIVFLRAGPMVLTKKPYQSWREIQDEYEDYMTSLGPWLATDVLTFIKEEYPTDPPFTRSQIDTFMASDDLILVSDR